MLIQGLGGAINHQTRAFLRLYSDSPLKLGQDRGVPHKIFPFVSFLKFLSAGIDARFRGCANMGGDDVGGGWRGGSRGDGQSK